MTFTELDKNNIKKAIEAGGDIWNNSLLGDLKQRIKTYFRIKQGEQCCYCRRPTVGEFKMVLDIEHVLPKSKFRTYMFTLINLGISCKRCNMQIKGEDISFFTGELQNKTTHFVSSSYSILHPNLDNYYSHIEYLVSIVNGEMLVKYNVLNNSSKGKNTYEYFNLIELEVDSLNNAQGCEKPEIISAEIDNDLKSDIGKKKEVFK